MEKVGLETDADEGTTSNTSLDLYTLFRLQTSTALRANISFRAAAAEGTWWAFTALLPSHAFGHW